MAQLELTHVSKAFGGLQAVNDLSFSVEEKEIVGLIGPNGAGKTTVFNLITGTSRVSSGTITFRGEEITTLTPDAINKKGIARTFQLVRTFNGLSALENVMAGAAFGSKPAANLKQAQEEAEEILILLGIVEKRWLPAGTLGLVDRKRLEIARALATKPKLLLLDEMFAGLNTAETDESITLVNKIRDTGISLIVVEHVMKVIMGISDRVVVLKVGTKLADCLPREIVTNEEIIEAYLGKKAIC